MVISIWGKLSRWPPWCLRDGALALYREAEREGLSSLENMWLWGNWTAAPSTYGEAIKKVEPGFFWQCIVRQWHKKCINWNERSRWMYGETFFPWGQSNIRRSYSERSCSLSPSLRVFKTQLEVRLPEVLYNLNKSISSILFWIYTVRKRTIAGGQIFG